MGRRRNGGIFQDLYEITAMVPWWVGLVLAVIAYLLLHAYASAPMPARVAGSPVALISAVFFKPAAGVFQYILPLILLAGAASSGLQRLNRRLKVKQVAGASSPHVLQDMTWQEFEALVSEAFRLRGFSVTETGGGGADGGVDLVLRKGSDKYLVQCKQWRAIKVGVVPARELYGVMAATGAAGGYMVTSGTFTDEARAFAAGLHLELIDGAQLFRMFDEVRAAVDTRIAPSFHPTPECPACGTTMVKRTARKGAHAGSEFWGCSTYPACRGTRAV